jgi:hypothetical protein
MLNFNAKARNNPVEADFFAAQCLPSMFFGGCAVATLAGS